MPKEKLNHSYKDALFKIVFGDYRERERARIMNILYSGLTQEQVESLHKWEVEQGREETRFEDIDKLVADGYYDEKRACEILGVDIEAYKEYLAGRSKE